MVVLKDRNQERDREKKNQKRKIKRKIREDKIIRKLYLKDCFDIKLKYAMNVFIHCAVEA